MQSSDLFNQYSLIDKVRDLTNDDLVTSTRHFLNVNFCADSD